MGAGTLKNEPKMSQPLVKVDEKVEGEELEETERETEGEHKTDFEPQPEKADVNLNPQFPFIKLPSPLPPLPMPFPLPNCDDFNRDVGPPPPPPPPLEPIDWEQYRFPANTLLRMVEDFFDSAIEIVDHANYEEEIFGEIEDIDH